MPHTGQHASAAAKASEGVLSRCDIAGAIDKICNELAVAPPHRKFASAVRRRRVGHITQTGRNSTVP